ncbi:MAG: hypothetical protein J5994_10705 [Ruminococcus sp.]|nr:hypothetical protein [Ruminococcus sp.]
MNARIANNMDFPSAEYIENVKKYVRQKLVFSGISHPAEVRYGYSICVGEYVEIAITANGHNFVKSTSALDMTELFKNINKLVRNISDEICASEKSSGD